MEKLFSKGQATPHPHPRRIQALQNAAGNKFKGLFIFIWLSLGIKTSFSYCSSGCGQKYYNPMYQNEASHAACYTSNLPKSIDSFCWKVSPYTKKNEAVWIKGSAQNGKWVQFHAKTLTDGFIFRTWRDL